MKVILIASIVLIIATLAIFFFYGTKEGGDYAPTVPQIAQEEKTVSEKIEEPIIDKVIVEYTKEGFSPSTLTIAKGTEVQFVNKSNKDMWVASALHPTHEEFPEFDQLTATGGDSTYSFVFSEIGEWKYHNHISPRDFGSISVTEDEQ